jgi:hypothetical protein
VERIYPLVAEGIAGVCICRTAAQAFAAGGIARLRRRASGNSEER